MRQHEDILVFYKDAPFYDSEGDEYHTPIEYKMACSPSESSHMTHSRDDIMQATHQRKRSIIKEMKIRNGHHPTQKPVNLMAFLIKTYTKPGELVLDFTMGSGTTLVAAKHSGRRCIGIEMDEGFCKIAVDRLGQQSLFQAEEPSGPAGLDAPGNDLISFLEPESIDR